MSTLKLTVLGAGAVGKSALTVQYTSGVFIDRYDPTIEDSYRKLIEVDAHQYLLEILDTAGTEHFTAMRDLYIKNGQGFLLVYSITSDGSFHELEEIKQQIQEIKDNEKCAMILIGNKNDLEHQRVVSMTDGRDRAARWGCPFLETSAKLNVNIEQAFVEVVKQVVDMGKDNKKKEGSSKSKEFTSDSGKKWKCVLV